MDDLDSRKEECELCEKGFQVISIPKNQEGLFTAWRTDCVDSMVRLVGLDTSSKEKLKTVRCCSKCSQLIRDVDFLFRSIQSFQSHLDVAQAKLKALLEKIKSKKLALCQSYSSTSIPVDDVREKEDGEKEPSASIKEEPQTPPPPSSSPTYLHRKRKLAQTLRGNFQFEQEKQFSRSLPRNYNVKGFSKVHTNDFESDQKSESEFVLDHQENDDGSKDDSNFDPLAPYQFHQPSSTLSDSNDREDTDDQEWAMEVVIKNKTRKKLGKRNEIKKIKVVKQEYVVVKNLLNLIACTFPSCEFQCKKPENLDVHVRSEHSGHPNPYQCTSCNKVFRSYHLLHSHRKSHEIVEEKTESLTCPVIECSQQFPYNKRRLLNKHMSRCHFTIEERLSCQFCGLTFPKGDDGKIEIGQHETKHQQRSVPFSCIVSNCDASFTNSFDLKKHVLQSHEHSEDRMNVCEKCPGKVFKSPRSLYAHKFRFHSGKMPEKHLKCEELGCSYVGRYQSDLIVHLSCHRDDRPYMCDECGSTYKAENTLRRHRLTTHTGRMPYKCTYCSKSFSMSQKLRAHEETHAPNLTYLCSGCGKAFRCRKNLDQHAKSHCPGLDPSQGNPMKAPLKKRKANLC